MRIMELAGWPPSEFQCTEDLEMGLHPAKVENLRIESVTFIAARPGMKARGDLVLTLVDKERTEICTTRWKMHYDDVARRTHSALELCKGLTLAQAGLREIPDEE